MSRTKKHSRGGFSLLELVIVVVIIGIVAAIAIPRMSRGTAGASDSAVSGDLAVALRPGTLTRRMPVSSTVLAEGASPTSTSTPIRTSTSTSTPTYPPTATSTMVPTPLPFHVEITEALPGTPWLWTGILVMVASAIGLAWTQSTGRYSSDD